eukprot:1866109-Amphidinium_carterae.1
MGRMQVSDTQRMPRYERGRNVATKKKDSTRERMDMSRIEHEQLEQRCTSGPGHPLRSWRTKAGYTIASKAIQRTVGQYVPQTTTLKEAPSLQSLRRISVGGERNLVALRCRDLWRTMRRLA